MYVNRLVEVFREVRRVLRDDGTLWLNLGDSYASTGCPQVVNTIKSNRKGGIDTQNAGRSRKPVGDLKPKDLVGIPWMVAFALRADGWYLRSDIIWSKPNAMPESVRDRPTKAHEYIFLLTKSSIYFYDHEAIKEQAVNGDPNQPRGSTSTMSDRRKRVNSGRRKQDEVGYRRYTGFNERYQPVERRNKRNKRTVWNISTKPFPGAHFAVFPPALVEPCVMAGSSPGDIILDPFAGTSTTGIVALQYSRRYIGLELNPDYVEISKKRIEDIG